jgi:tripartite-type tricarboxylate transporter receptor subunit TctC
MRLAMKFRQITKWPLWLCISAIAAASLSAGGASAQTRGRTVTIVVPYTPGTGPDMLARVIGEELQQRLGQPVIVENKPGAGGNIGTQFVAKAPPDGHTLLMASMNLTQKVGLYKNGPYDPVKSFEPIIEVAESFLALAVHPSTPATSARAFIDYLKGRRRAQLQFSGARHAASPFYGALQARNWR